MKKSDRHQNRHILGREKASRVERLWSLHLFILQSLSWCREGGSNPHEVALGGF